MQHTQRVGIFVHRGDEARRERVNGLIVFRRALDDLVVDVGDVAYIVDIVTACLEPAIHHIEHYQHARMAEVAIVVHRHAAHVHAGLARSDGHEFLLVTRQRVVDF